MLVFVMDTSFRGPDMAGCITFAMFEDKINDPDTCPLKPVEVSSRSVLVGG
jgi:hypothetical protein